MADLHLCSGLVTHFTMRLKQYLLFLQLTNDHQLIEHLLGFLNIRDVLNFLSTSSHFNELRKIQSIEIRILRGKLSFYEKPKEMSGIEMWARCFPMKLDDQHNKNPIVIKPDSIKIAKNTSIFQLLKKKGSVESKEALNMDNKKGTLDLSNFYDLHKEEEKSFNAAQAQPKKPSSWSQINQEQLRFFKQYRGYFIQNSNNDNKKLNGSNKKVAEYTPSASRLETIEYRMAKQDYQRRKIKKIRELEHSQFISLQDVKKLAERDSCSRLVLQRLEQQEYKTKQQQQNISKLRMKPAPKIQNLKLDVLESQKQVKVLKQSIAGKVYTGIKSLIVNKQ